MLRKVLLPVAAIVVIGLAAFWFLTSPATVSADSLGPHTPNLANGKTMFLAGDCSSCHAVPLQADSTRLGGGGVYPIPEDSHELCCANQSAT